LPLDFASSSARNRRAQSQKQDKRQV